MKYRLTLLNVFSIIIIILVNYDYWTSGYISDTQGWSKLALLTVNGAGILGLLIDLGLQFFIKNYMTINGIELIIVGSLLIYTWLN